MLTVRPIYWAKAQRGSSITGPREGRVSALVEALGQTAVTDETGHSSASEPGAVDLPETGSLAPRERFGRAGGSPCW